MSRYNLTFNILKNRFPFRWAGANLNKFTDVFQASFLRMQDLFNSIYDCRFITYASAHELDLWGDVLDKKRVYEEDDQTYRARLLVAFRDIINSLTINSYKDAIEAVMSERPECIEHYALQATWPFTWSSPLLSQKHDLVASFIVPDEITNEQIETITDDLSSVKLATLYVWLVTDQQTHYELVKEIL